MVTSPPPWAAFPMPAQPFSEEIPPDALMHSRFDSQVVPPNTKPQCNTHGWIRAHTLMQRLELNKDLQCWNVPVNTGKSTLKQHLSQVSRLLQKDAEQESQMRAEIQTMKQELATISMMDEFARYARLERKINKMTDKLKTHVKARTAQLAKIKWVINIVFYILQAALMISLIWKYYSEPVTVLPSKWLAPLERLVAFPTGVAGGVGITCWLVVCNKVVAIMLHPFS
uniref:Guided entry of tail-anchored proteins factor 1 n=8 Tax=Passeriformes TaxID=9126 RepID=A0A803VGX0_FICAL